MPAEILAAVSIERLADFHLRPVGRFVDRWLRAADIERPQGNDELVLIVVAYAKLDHDAIDLDLHGGLAVGPFAARDVLGEHRLAQRTRHAANQELRALNVKPRVLAELLKPRANERLTPCRRADFSGVSRSGHLFAFLWCGSLAH